MQFGNRYLCNKYTMQMIAVYLNQEAVLNTPGTFSHLLAIVGSMPFELFSASESIIYTDREGLEYSAYLIDKIGKEELQNTLRQYLSDIF